MSRHVRLRTTATAPRRELAILSLEPLPPCDGPTALQPATNIIAAPAAQLTSLRIIFWNG